MVQVRHSPKKMGRIELNVKIRFSCMLQRLLPKQKNIMVQERKF